MRFFSVFKSNAKLIVIICLFAFVMLLLALLLFFNNSTPKNKAVNLGLNDYAKLKNEVNSLFSNQALTQNPSFNQFATLLVTVENTKLSAKDKYNALIQADNNLGTAYFQTNQHALYNLLPELSNFAKTNFPDLYKADDFPGTLCMDKICADKPQPDGILKIVNELNASNAPSVVKQVFTRDLLNPGYMDQKDVEIKVGYYIMVAGMLQTSGGLTKAGLNEKFSKELTDYVKKAYPEEYARENPTQK